MTPLCIKIPKTAQEAINRLERAGFEAYAVGGCVRDSLLNRTPNDWDITTSATPEQTELVFADFRTVKTGIQHGTLTVILDGTPLEITTYRQDGAYADNRHPVSVSFSSRLEDDLCRRDFTVNAMAYHPARGLVDLFGGQTDLNKKIIACVGDPATRFREDGLRILRALRFASVLDFSINPTTADAIHACRTLLSNIAAERIREEFVKLVCGVGATRVLREYSDVISVFLPELGNCVGFAQNSKYHVFDVFEHTVRALEYNTSANPITRLSILLHDIGKPLTYTEDAEGGHFKGHGPVGTELTRKILRRLRFDNETAAAITQLVEYHDRPIPAEARSVKRLMQKMSDENILRLLEVQRCDRLSHAPAYSTPSPDLAKIPEILKSVRESDECFSLKSLAVNGNDLLSLGYPKGKQLGDTLNALLEAVIDGILPNDKELLLNEAKRKLKKHL